MTTSSSPDHPYSPLTGNPAASLLRSKPHGDPDARHGKWSVLAFRFIVPAMLEGCMKAIELLGARSIEREEGWPLEFMFRESMIHNLYRTPNVDMKFLASYLVQRRL